MLRTVNPCVDTDLFWALRSGGGGTLGVATSVTMRAYPSPQASRHEFSMTLIDSNSLTEYWNLVARAMSELPRLYAGGMQGYSIITPPEVYGLTSWVWQWGFDMYDKPNGIIESLIALILEIIDPKNGTKIVYTSRVDHYVSFFGSWNATVGFEAVAWTGAALGPRLLPAAALTDDTDHLARVLPGIATPAKESEAPPMLQAAIVAHDNSALIRDTSITSAWKDAVLYFIVIDFFPDSKTFEESKPVFDKMTYERVAALKRLAPQSGAYLNEVRLVLLHNAFGPLFPPTRMTADSMKADPYDPKWQYEFWGTNYPKLRDFKKMYDPESVLWFLSCVGSEY